MWLGFPSTQDDVSLTKKEYLYDRNKNIDWKSKHKGKV